MDWGVLDVDADRWTPFVETWQFEGEDWTGATFAMQVRLFNDAPGDPLLSLETVTTAAAEGVRLVYAGTATVDAHIAAGRLNEVPEGLASEDSLALSLVGVRINETSMEAMPFPGERGDNATLAWDLHVTPAGGLKSKLLGGHFTVLSGATQ